MQNKKDFELIHLQIYMNTNVYINILQINNLTPDYGIQGFENYK